MKIHACARSNLQAAREFSSKMFVGVLRQRKGNGDYIRNYVKYKEILAYTFSYNDFIRGYIVRATTSCRNNRNSIRKHCYVHKGSGNQVWRVGEVKNSWINTLTRGACISIGTQ